MAESSGNLFIIGNPRSGTSLLRIMLNSHSKITVPPECGFIQWWYKKYKNWTKNSNVENFIADLKTSKKIETWQLDFEKLKEFLVNEKPKSYEELVFKIIEFYGKTKLKKVDHVVLGDKNNYYINHLEELSNISEHVSYLFIIRNPKDVYCSYKGISELKSTSKYIPKLSQDILEFCEEWNDNHERILSFIKTKSKNKYLLLTFENLVSNPFKELNRISSFLKVPFEENMLRYYNNNDEPEGLLDWKKKTLQPPDMNSIGRYKSILTEKEIKTIDAETGSTYNYLLKICSR